MGLQVETHPAEEAAPGAAFFLPVPAHIGQAARSASPRKSFWLR